MSDFIKQGKNVLLRDRMTVTLPEGEFDGVKVQRFEIKPHSLSNLRAAIKDGRGTRPGMYTKLTEGRTFWMSDTDAEKEDHIPAVQAIQMEKAERVLIHGLGLGMVLAAALSYEHVKQVDVVERDERVIKLIGPHYTVDDRVTIHHADAFEHMRSLPANAGWDVVWTDIWPEICADNLPQMKEFSDFFVPRSKFHGNWAEDVAKRSVWDNRHWEKTYLKFLSPEDYETFREEDEEIWEDEEDDEDE